MMRSMFAGVSGLKAHQTRMDIIGNNIANVNSAGYKSSRVTFQDMLSQTMRAATAPSANRGGTNPHQVGLGVSLGSIDVKHTQGNTQSTGYITDLAIEGDGFFIVGQGENRQYTRAGMFGLDDGTTGNLVSLVTGDRVMGYKADSNGRIDQNATIEPLYISASETIPPRATDRVIFGGNLDNRYSVDPEIDAPIPRTVQVFDSRGREHTIVVTFGQQGDNKWSWNADMLMMSDPIPSSNFETEGGGTYSVITDIDDVDAPFKIVWQADDSNEPKVLAVSEDGRSWVTGDALDADSKDVTAFEFEAALNGNDKIQLTVTEGFVTITATRDISPGTGNNFIAFNDDGSFSRLITLDSAGDEIEGTGMIVFDLPFADNLEIDLDFSDFTQYADTFTGKFMHQNGFANGALESYAIDQNGTIIGSFSNGLTRALGQVALARFANPAGLARAGSTMFVDTANSGDAQIGAAGVPGFGAIAPSSLEMSNVDLSEEFTEMIITQRGFQANSRIITSSDEMLQELVNLKR